MKPFSHILIVDDSPDTLEVLRRNLISRGYHISSAVSAEEALKILKSERVHLVITDIKMPGASGMDLLRYIRENLKDVEVVLITGYPRYDEAISAMKTGAEEYLIKPFTSAELFRAVDSAFRKQRLRHNVSVPHILPNKFGIIGDSPPMLKLYAEIAKATETDATLLIQGESGTGKELVCRAIHYGSSRAASPFVTVNCGGIPESLLESELFGHLKGAFTGAVTTRAGFFQTADTGSILLDEISEASPSMQVKLLRVLQEKEIFMLGSRRPIKVDIRIMAATNKHLSALVKKDAFREDLFYRLNVLSIDLPPLRDRGDDILLLANYFLRKFCAEFRKKAPEISDRTLQILQSYQWPGNVRELENVVMRIASLTEGEIVEAPDLPVLMRFSPLCTGDDNRTLAEIEADHIRNVLARVDGNKTAAAKILGIDRSTLRQKLKAGEEQDDKSD